MCGIAHFIFLKFLVLIDNKVDLSQLYYLVPHDNN